MSGFRPLGALLLAGLMATGPAPVAHGQFAAPPEAPGCAACARLEQALARYESIAAAGGWPSLPDGPTIGPDSADPRIPALATRLVASGDLARGHDGREYDDALQAAVRRFQSRHGLEPDALVGRRTLAALNVPATARVEQLRLNAARTRDVLADAPDDLLLINIPAFEAYLYRDGALAWTTRVIIGETETETPQLNDEIEYVVLNPTWTVPRSIATEELLPKIRSDIQFLERGGYEVRDPDGEAVDPASVDWAALHRDNFPYTLVQAPGSRNELGRVKFMFPNDYGVCAHDTPARYLFEYRTRAYSHGCIRMDQPIDLASQLLEPLGWTRAQLDESLQNGETETVVLEAPLPVIVTYLTAFVHGDGTVHFYGDVYARDGIATGAPP